MFGMAAGRSLFILIVYIMKTKRHPRHTEAQIRATAHRAVDMLSLWEEVEIIDDVITGRLVVRPVTDIENCPFLFVNHPILLSHGTEK